LVLSSVKKISRFALETMIPPGFVSKNLLLFKHVDKHKT